MKEAVLDRVPEGVTTLEVGRLKGETEGVKTLEGAGRVLGCAIEKSPIGDVGGCPPEGRPKSGAGKRGTL
jgi:hypothetical protein